MPSRVFRLLLPHIVIDTWVFAGLWVWRAAISVVGLRRVPDLLDPSWDRLPKGAPSLIVIVPARNEGQTIEPALRSLAEQDYPGMRVLAVNDRSTDNTGEIMERLAASYPDRISVMHIEELPPGWLGKTHAMATAARFALGTLEPEFLLFTDADVHFRPDAIRRSLVAAVEYEADHLVTLPTPVVRGLDEAAFLGLFQVMGLWAVRLWHVADPRRFRDSIGIGAFALLRSSAYQALGGFEALRMEILEDLYLGRLVKEKGLRQRVLLGRDLVRVHWAPGAMGVVGVLTKNLFSLFRFRLWLVLFVAFWLAVFSVGPLFALFFPQTVVPALLTIAAVALCYRLMSRFSGISPWTFLLAPPAGLLLVYSMLRSTLVTLRQGGVRWRGTFYSLRELRAQAGPLFARRRLTLPAGLSDGNEAGG